MQTTHTPATTPEHGSAPTRSRTWSSVVATVAALIMSCAATALAVPATAAASTTPLHASAAQAPSAAPTAANPPANPGSGAGNGGGTSVPEGYFSQVTVWQNTDSPPVSGCLGACRARESGAEVRYNNKCRGGNRWGPWEGVEGFEEGRHNYKPGSGKTPGHTWYSAASYDCISAAAWTETPVNCVITYTTRVIGPTDNPHVRKETRTLHDQAQTAFAQTGKTKPVLCERSRALNVGTSLNHYGKWRIKASRRVATCTLYSYIAHDVRTKRIPPDRIGDCATLPSDTVAAKAQVICERPGWTRGWSDDHAYTPQDCLTHPGGVWDCGPRTAPARLDGRPATPANVINDGSDHSLQWTPPAPRGEVRKVHEDRVRLAFLGGTPHRGGVDNAADTQPFIVNPTVDDWVYGWAGMGDTTGTDFVVNFQAASVAGRPWTAAPQWAFTADFGKTVPHVHTLDAFDATFRADDAYDWERLPGSCTGTSASVSVFAPRQR
jgi:hypothetical protein